jgi:putative ABC transport system permease protein
VVPTDPFAFIFLESALNQLYKNEKITQTLINFSTLITMIISCLGLIGLGFYTTRQRMKEISIRKVLGGSVIGLVIHLTKNIVKWVVIANIFAWPIAWLIANNWLQNFASRITVSLWIFLFAGVFTVTVALLAVSYQTIKGANINPAECLRRE